MIAAILLAAGGARRFGSPKLLAPLAGRPLVRHTAERLAAARLDDLVVVLGREPEALRGALDGLPARFVENPRWAEGMSTSLAAGVSALRPNTRAAVIALGDQPVPVGVVEALVAAHAGSDGAAVVVPRYAGVRGNPVLFDADLFPELLASTGDEGARHVVARDPARVLAVDFPFAAPRDVDRPEDLAALERELAPGG